MEVVEEQRILSPLEGVKNKELNAKSAFESFIKYRRWYEQNFTLSENDIDRLNETQECIEAKYSELHMKRLNFKCSDKLFDLTCILYFLIMIL